MAEWVRLGDRAIRFPRPRGVSPRALLDHLRGWPGVVDSVVAREDVAVYFAGAPAFDAGAIEALSLLSDATPDARTVEIPVVYDGPDLDAVAVAAGLAADEVARVHADATYEVEIIGFAPGFAYLVGLDARLQLPRRATPRERVPAGSVAMAGSYTGVYPFDSPGGWHLIGRVVDVVMFGPDGALLRHGDRVRFVR